MPGTRRYMTPMVNIARDRLQKDSVEVTNTHKHWRWYRRLHVDPMKSFSALVLQLNISNRKSRTYHHRAYHGVFNSLDPALDSLIICNEFEGVLSCMLTCTIAM